MEYQVLARKWRPQCFADVVGQKHITQTLQSELIQDKTAHAYLFVGPRGIGKTSIARIFAKALNCKNGPVKEPCCQCESCVAIAEGNSLDLIEIDGASNNSVDDIRQLREEVLYAPTSSRFKIYIIDEVHMLSNNAWNALLKTIEEPPPHAKFLFATTEAHKVLPTVVSRCQRFDLQRITFKLITEQMKKIATAEGVHISDAAIEVIARAADGGMRDAQSLLDQMIAFTSADQSEVSEEQALAIFGLTGVAEMEKLIRAILLNDRAVLIASIHRLASQGKNLEKLFEDILDFLRGIQISIIMDEPENILEVGDDLLNLYKKLAAETNSVMLQKLLENLSTVTRMLHDALNKQVFLETIILKAMRISHAVDIEALLHRLNQLRKGGELIDLEKIPSLTQVPQPPPASSVTSQTEPSPAVKPGPVAAPSLAPVSASTELSPVDTVQAQPQTVASSETSPVSAAQPQADVLPTPSLSVKPEPPAMPSSALSPAAPIPASTPQISQEVPVFPAAPVSQIMKEAEVSSADISNAHEVNNSAIAPISDAAVDSKPDVPPAFPTPQSNTLPEQEVPKTAFEAQALHVLEHPKETGPVKIEDSPETAFSADSQKLSPESLWHSAIEEMDHCQQPLLKAYMQEGRPESLTDGELTVVYDEESEAMHISEIQKEKALIETCLRRISGNAQITLNVAKKRGILSPGEITHQNSKDLAEVQKRAENNPFVKDVMDLFDGTIVDVKG